MPPMSPPRAPAISVVVPFFDSERYIAACVESLLGQEDVDGSFEIILVDNGSRDGSARILARYSALTVLEEPTPGAYAARNAGIRRARAPIVAFTDADCIADRHWLRAVARGMQDPTVAILIGRCVYPEDARFSLRLLAAYENAKAAYVVERCAPRYQFAYANNMAVRASVFAEVGRAGASGEEQATRSTAGLSALDARHPHGVPSHARPAPPSLGIHEDQLANRDLQRARHRSAARAPVPLDGLPLA
jgi:glycosyltransferase involved in cell wall biosynthesis